MSIRKAISNIRISKKVLIITHVCPDGDALGSSLGLKLALEKSEKQVDVCCAHEVPSTFAFLPGSTNIEKDFLLGDYDQIIIIDCGDLRRTGYPHRIKEFKKHKNKIINIDHHPKNDLHKFSSINIVDYGASSAAEIVYEIIKKLKINIDKNIALNLLCGLYTDTKSFQHSNTTTKCLLIASNLLKRGARLKQITDNVTNNHSVSSLRLWGLALSRLKINRRYSIATSVVNMQDLKRCGASISDAAGIVNIINTIPEIKVALFMYQIDNDTIKASLRTESDKINLSKLAKCFGGGGLKKASGFSISGRIRIDKSKFFIEYV